MKTFSIAAFSFLMLCTSVYLKAQNSQILSDRSYEIFEVINAQKENQFYVDKNDKIKIWVKGGWPIKGHFVNIMNDSIYVDEGSTVKSAYINDIAKLRLFKKGTARQVLGKVLLGVGILAVAAGGVSLVAGIVLAVQESLGAVLIIAAPNLGWAGAGLILGGNSLIGKKYKIGKKWLIEY